jgi:hypothetical protein
MYVTQGAAVRSHSIRTTRRAKFFILAESGQDSREEGQGCITEQINTFILAGPPLVHTSFPGLCITVRFTSLSL